MSNRRNGTDGEMATFSNVGNGQTIKLFKHNQNAYGSLIEMLASRDRACVIKPTGTGKFVIIAKMVQDHPDKRFLLIGTNQYMFQDQMDNLAQFAPGFVPENLDFITYSKAMSLQRVGERICGYDCIVADEFHHCGAREWSKGVTYVMQENPAAKVIGFSATPIRHSDGGRDMADEMFDGNVAYSMEVEEAWLKGILPMPKYIAALYESPQELGDLAKRIGRVRDDQAKARFQEKYERLRRALTEAGGVREVIHKYLEKPSAKVVAFCPNAEKLREFSMLARDWFGAVNEDIHVYRTTCADPNGERDFAAFKGDSSSALKVLYCINQLNEAVHIRGIDAIVMVRPTKSPTVYFQQLGRVLSSGGSRAPLVFDLCNNFGSIAGAREIRGRLFERYEAMLEDGERPPFTPDDFDVVGDVLEWGLLISEINDSLAGKQHEAHTLDEKISLLERIAAANGGKL